MQYRLISRLSSVAAGLVGAVAINAAANAQALPKEGAFDFTSCWSGVSNVIAFSKTDTAFTFEFLGNTLSNPPGGMFDRNTYRCVGMNTALDGKKTSNVVCETVDPDGDKRLSNFELTPDGKTIRRTVSGTGKYEGMVETSTVTLLGVFPVIKAGTFQSCNRQKGTYKLK